MAAILSQPQAVMVDDTIIIVYSTLTKLDFLDFQTMIDDPSLNTQTTPL